jgi:hypothetical protein
VSKVSLLVPITPVRGQLHPEEPPSSSGSIMGKPHLQEYLALHLHLNLHGPVETVEIGETSSRLWLGVEGLHGNEAPVGATW